MADKKIEYYDLADNEVKIGNFVAYAASLGRCPILKYGIVTRLEVRDNRYDYMGPKQVPTLRVLTVEKDDHFTQGGKFVDRRWMLQKKGGEMALGFLDRLIVVDKVPPMVKKILTEALTKFNASKR